MTARHLCHWPGCTVEVEPQFWGCRPHWLALPKSIRMDIWRHYRKGQEITKDPSDEYIAAAVRAREWIYEHDAGAVPVAQGELPLLARGDDASTR